MACGVGRGGGGAGGSQLNIGVGDDSGVSESGSDMGTVVVALRPPPMKTSPTTSHLLADQ